MKAYVYSEKGKLRLGNVDQPRMPLGGALAKIRLTSICGTDLRTHRFGNDHIPLPRIIGHEALYELEEVSKELSGKFSPGERVIIAPAIGCGSCPSCKRGRTNMCNDLHTIGFEFDGTFAEYCAIPEQAFRMGNVIKVPAHVKDEDACVVEPAACAINGQNFLGIQPGENVLIFGAGYVGSIHAELAFIKGAGKVIVAEIGETRRQKIKQSIPEVETVNSTDEDLSQQIAELTSGAGVDVIITACPVGKTHTQAVELANKSGRICLFGGLPGESKGYLDSNLIHYKELGVFGVHASTPTQNRQALQYMTDGQLKAGKYLTSFSFDDIEQAFQALANETAVKAVLKF